ncbi:MAG: hypothetical protein V4801_02495 [Burkholderia gladioli]
MESHNDINSSLLAIGEDATATKVLLHYLLAFFNSADNGFLVGFVAHCEASVAFAKASKSIEPSASLRAMLDRLSIAALQQ